MTKVQKDKQRSTKHTHKTKDRVTRTSPKTGGELMCSRRVSSSCSTSDTRRVNLVTKRVIRHEWRTGKCLPQVEHIHSHLWHRYSITVNQVMVATVKLSRWWLHLNQEEPLVQQRTKRNPWFIGFLVSSNPLSRKSWQEPQALNYRINWEICAPYATGMLLHINGKFTMGKLKSS
jgi:hypothetical protein